MDPSSTEKPEKKEPFKKSSFYYPQQIDTKSTSISYQNTLFDCCSFQCEKNVKLVGITNHNYLYQKLIDSNGISEEKLTIQFQNDIDCFCYSEDGCFVFVGTRDGKISICSVEKGIFFSQKIIQITDSSKECFCKMCILSNDNSISLIVSTSTNEIIVIDNIHLSLLCQSLQSEDTTTLLKERQNIQLLIYDFSSYFTKITSLISESNHTILISGIGEYCLLRVQFQSSHHSVQNHLLSSSLQTDGILQLSSSIHSLLVVCSNGTAYLLDKSSFFLLSYFSDHSIHTGYLIPYNETPTPSQMYCILASSNEVFLCSLQFGNMKIESLEFESPSLLLLSSSFFLSTDSNSVSFYQLSLASDRQKYLMLLEKDQLEEALKLAQSKQLNSDLVYKRMIQKQCVVWNDLSQQEWMQSPCYDCSEIFQILNHSSLSLLLYVFDSYLIPSRLTMDSLLLFGYSQFMNNSALLEEQDQQRFLLLHLKWKVFLKGQFMLDKVDSFIWQRFQHMSLLQIEYFFLKRNILSILLYLWNEYTQFTSDYPSFIDNQEIQEMIHQSLYLCSEYILQRQQLHLSIHSDILVWLTQYILTDCSSQLRFYFIEWIVTYCNDLTSHSFHSLKAYTNTLQNISIVLSCILQCSWISDPSFHSLISSLCQYHSYFTECLTVVQQVHIQLPLSNQLQIPSNEEIAILVLDSMNTAEILQQSYHSHFVPFCQSHNMNTDEVCSYYIQKELEKTVEVDIPRILYLWKQIISHEYQIEAFKGLITRSPPYSDEIINTLQSCYSYNDISIVNYSFLREQVPMLILSNRIYELRMDSFLLVANQPAYVLLNALINRYNEKTVNDLRLLCNVYRELSYEDAVLSLGMTVLEDGKDMDIMKDTVCEMKENEENLQILIEYGIELLNNNDLSAWNSQLELVLFIIKEIHENSEIVVFGMPLSQVYSLLQQVQLFYQTFHFCLPASFIQNNQETCERIINACIQPDGYTNEFTQQVFIYQSSLPKEQKECVAGIFNISIGLLDLLSFFNEVFGRENTQMYTPFSFTSLSLRSESHWLQYLLSLLPFLFNDLFTSLSSCINQLLTTPSSTNLLQQCRFILDFGLSFCLCLLEDEAIILHCYSTVLSYHSILMIFKKLFDLSTSSSFLQPLPYSVYEEPGLQVDSIELYQQLVIILQSIFDKEPEENDMLTDSIHFFTDHQLELTCLPLLPIISQQPKQSITFLLQQNIQRILTAYPTDRFVILLTLRSLPSQTITSILRTAIQSNTTHQLSLSSLGTLYSFLLHDYALIQSFSLLEALSSFSSIQPSFSSFQPSFLQSLPSLLQSLSHQLNHSLQALLSLHSFLPQETSTFYLLILQSCIESHDLPLIHRCISLEQTLLSPYLMNDLLDQAIHSINGLNYELIHYVCKEQQLINGKNEEMTKILNISEFALSHPEAFHQVDCWKLLSNPWDELHSHITIYNIRDYYLLFSYCDLSLERCIIQVLENCLKQSTIPEWSVISSLFSHCSSHEAFISLSQISLEASHLYLLHHSYCETFPCPVCQDAVDAALSSCSLIQQVLEEMEESEEKQQLTNQFTTVHDYYCSVVFDYHRNRLGLGKEGISNELKEMKWKEVKNNLPSLYFKLASIAGMTLQKHYIKYTENLIIERKQEEELRNPSRKRERRMIVEEDKLNCGFTLHEDEGEEEWQVECNPEVYSELIKQKGTSIQQNYHLFNEESCGSLYVHSFMLILSTVSSQAYEDLFYQTLLLFINYQSLSKTEKEREDEDNQIITGLIYLIEATHQMTNHSFSQILSFLIHSSSSIRVESSYYIIKALQVVLSHIPANEHIEGIPSLETLQVKELEYSIQRGCKRFGISIGENVLLQAKNQTFLLSILNRFDISNDLLYWCFQVIKRLNVKEERIWKTLVEKGKLLGNNQLLLECWLIKPSLSIQPEVISSLLEKKEDTELVVKLLTKRTCCVDDNQILEWCRMILQEKNLDISELVMNIVDLKKRKEGLKMIIENGNEMSILPFITINGKPIELYRKEYEDVIEKMMKEGELKQLFYSDYYEEVIQWCFMKEKKEYLNRWIAYHIKEKQLEEAIHLIHSLGFYKEIDDDMVMLHEYIIDVLKDETLLPFLFTV